MVSLMVFIQKLRLRYQVPKHLSVAEAFTKSRNGTEETKEWRVLLWIQSRPIGQGLILA